jgi:hypothetical protein
VVSDGAQRPLASRQCVFPSQGTPKPPSTRTFDCVVGNKELPAKIREDIIERTDGIPLFVEEMTKAVLEVGGEGEPWRGGSNPGHGDIRKPARIVDGASRPARLGQGGSANRGGDRPRIFDALLAAVARNKPEAELASALDRLIAAGLLFRQGATTCKLPVQARPGARCGFGSGTTTASIPEGIQTSSTWITIPVSSQPSLATRRISSNRPSLKFQICLARI